MKNLLKEISTTLEENTDFLGKSIKKGSLTIFFFLIFKNIKMTKNELYRQLEKNCTGSRLYRAETTGFI